MEPSEQSFDYRGHRIAYRSWDAGDRTLVLIHGLLMNGRMFARLAPEIAARGNRVVCVDLLGHGDSDKPEDYGLYSMTSFADQVVGLVDHLGVDRPVVGGTSLGANVSLELAVNHPGCARGLLVEMPVLDNALVAVAMAFTPVMVAAELGAPLLRGVAAAARRVPRSHHLLDIGLDWLRRDPDTTAWVLQGLLLGRTAPPRHARREIDLPALVVGHRSDPIHPFSDSDELVAELDRAELIDANSILEWRLNPGRLDDALADFLARVHRRDDQVRAAA